MPAPAQGMNFESHFEGILLAFFVQERHAPVDLQNGEFVKGDCAEKRYNNCGFAMVRPSRF